MDLDHFFSAVVDDDVEFCGVVGSGVSGVVVGKTVENVTEIDGLMARGCGRTGCDVAG